MRKKKIYSYMNKNWKFNSTAFKNAFSSKASSANFSPSLYEAEFGDLVGIPGPTIHNWIINRSEPSDFGKIQLVADSLGIQVENLLEDSAVEELKSNGKRLTDREKEALKHVWTEYYKAREAFIATQGFCMIENRLEKDYNAADILYKGIEKALELEYIDLREKLFYPLTQYLNSVLKTAFMDEYFEIEDEDDIHIFNYTWEEAVEWMDEELQKIIDPFLV